MTKTHQGPITPPVTPPKPDPRPGFWRHAIVYAATCLMLIAFNAGLGGTPWSLYAAAGWGIGLFAHGLAAHLKRRDQTDGDGI